MVTFPNLEMQPGNPQLSFPWAEYVSKSGSTFNGSFGPDGVVYSMMMDVYWSDLPTAVQELLGYSKVISTGFLNRVLPFQHPYWNQLWCTRISEVRGIAFDGKEFWINDAGMGVISDYTVARLTLQFTRPPYPVLADSDPDLADPDTGTDPAEWLRFTDRLWQPQVQMLSRQAGSFKFTNESGVPSPPSNHPFTTSIGQKVAKIGLKRCWYQLPEAAVYTDSGFPQNLLYSVSSNSTPSARTLLVGCVNDATFFGCAAGTLLYTAFDIKPRPLQIPPELMGIVNEAVQLQYDVTLNFEYFDPPRKPGTTFTQRGHNLFPWNDAYWYPGWSVSGNNRLFASASFPDIFKIL